MKVIEIGTLNSSCYANTQYHEQFVSLQLCGLTYNLSKNVLQRPSQ